MKSMKFSEDSTQSTKVVFGGHGDSNSGPGDYCASHLLAVAAIVASSAAFGPDSIDYEVYRQHLSQMKGVPF